MKNKIYSFSTDDAVSHGIDAAIILHNMRYWLDHARVHGEMEQEGYYWMYMTASKMVDLFPFWSANKIQKELKKLEERGVVITGNYNKSSWNRTKWYTMPEFCIQRNGGMESAKRLTPISEKADSLYDQYEDSNSNKDIVSLEDEFEAFWVNATHTNKPLQLGLKKVNKSQSLKSFKAQVNKLSKEYSYSNGEDNYVGVKAFTMMLIDDVSKRCKTGQYGFENSLHPTTYLNNQRWEDEYETTRPTNKPDYSDGLSDSQRAMLQARKERDAAQQNNGSILGENGRALLR